ncbi:hypothetical protein CUMW_101790 [Citrus unshiu]|nr:hypothetical protein CUMW_101790 [Citrus unshiu]
MWDLGITALYYLDLSNNFLTNIEYFPPTNMTQLNFDSNLTHKEFYTYGMELSCRSQIITLQEMGLGQLDLVYLAFGRHVVIWAF